MICSDCSGSRYCECTGFMRSKTILPFAIAGICGWAEGTPKGLNPAVAQIVAQVSAEQIASTQKKLGTFRTRNIYSSQTDPKHGIGAARRWIAQQFRSFSPRLEVSFDRHGIRASGRVFKDVEIYNVIAVLPGSSEPERRLIVSGHYDSMNMIFKTDAAGKRVLDAEATAAAVAPGVTDDGSGTAAVLELARVMSRQTFRKTIIFIAFAGEEYGLLGSSTYAEGAKIRGNNIEGVLNNDIIGSDTRGDGAHGNRKVNVFSEDPDDSPSRELARYVKETGERYLPEMDVNLVFRYDRFGEVATTALLMRADIRPCESQLRMKTTRINTLPPTPLKIRRLLYCSGNEGECSRVGLACFGAKASRIDGSEQSRGKVVRDAAEPRRFRL